MPKRKTLGGLSTAQGLRTTLSIQGDLADRLRRIAAKNALTPIEAIRAAVQQYAEFEDGPGAAMRVPDLLKPIRGLSNHYQVTAASWRLGRTLEQLQGISGGRLQLDTHSAEEYLLRVLADLHGSLGTGDEYLVLTGRQFWVNAQATKADRDYLHESEFWRYLNAQGKAVGRGMRLVRVVVLTEEEQRYSRDILELHRDFLDQVRRGYPDCQGHVDVRVKRLRSGKGQAVGQPFAYIRRVAQGTALASMPRGGPAFVVEPRYDAKPQIIELGLTFSDNRKDDDPTLRTYWDRFQQALDGSDPIEVVLESMKSRRSAPSK
jgi:hypothetical protein